MTDKIRSYDLGEGQLVTLVVATDEGPLQVDVAITTRELDPDDPRRPGDIIWPDGFLWLDRGDFIAALEAAARALRDAD